jgi:hypothetical protein
MTEVLQSPSHFQPSPSSSSTPNDGSHPHALFNTSTLEDHLGTEEEEEEEEEKKKKKKDLELELEVIIGKGKKETEKVTSCLF